MTWVLVVMFLNWRGPAIAFQEFKDEAACERVAGVLTASAKYEYYPEQFHIACYPKGMS